MGSLWCRLSCLLVKSKLARLMWAKAAYLSLGWPDLLCTLSLIAGGVIRGTCTWHTDRWAFCNPSF